jgi:hypothetical protein
MSVDPLKDSEQQDPVSENAGDYRRFYVRCVLAFVVMFLIHLARHDQLNGKTMLSYVVGNGLSTVLVFPLLTLIERRFRGIRWRMAALDSAILCVSMFLADLAYAYLYLR